MASLLPPAEVTFTDANGVPLVGGTVTFYVPNSTTPKNTWQDSAQSILNPNPVTLDAAGRAIIYGSGSYRQVVNDSKGNLIWDQITGEPGQLPISYAGTSGGTANAQVLSSGTFSGLDGSVISFIAGISNTSAMTLSIGGSAPVQVLKNGASGPVVLAAGDIILGNIYLIQYSSSRASFLLLPSVPVNSQASAFLLSYVSGLLLSNNAVDSTHSIDVATGSIKGPNQIVANSSVLTKSIASNWVAGNNQGGLDIGAVAASTTYNVGALIKVADSTFDAIFWLYSNTLTVPTGYVFIGRIGSILTDASSLVVSFVQHGNIFYTAKTAAEYSGGAVAFNLRTITGIPNGISVRGKFILEALAAAGGSTLISVYDYDMNSGWLAAGSNFTFPNGTTSVTQRATGTATSNTSRQIGFFVSTAGGSSSNLFCNGWDDYTIPRIGA